MKLLYIISLAVFAIGGECLVVVPMSDWAGETSHQTEKLQNPVPYAIIAHTVTPECSTDEECVGLLKNIRSNLIAHGHADMAYNFMIGGNGKVYEGAGWKLLGSHTKGYNRQSIGIGFIGDFRDKPPTSEALQAGKDLLNDGLKDNFLSQDYKLVGQRQLKSSISPGDTLQQEIQSWSNWTQV